MTYTVTNYATKKAYAGMNLNLLQAAGVPDGHSVITLNQFAEIVGRPLWPTDEEIKENAPEGGAKSWAVNTYKDRKKSMFMTRFTGSTKGKWIRLMGAHNTFFVIDTQYCKFDNIVEPQETEEKSPITSCTVPDEEKLTFSAGHNKFAVNASQFATFTPKKMKEFLSAIDNLTKSQADAIVGVLNSAKMDARTQGQAGHMGKNESAAKQRNYTQMVNMLEAAIA